MRKAADPNTLDGFREAKHKAQGEIGDIIARFEKQYRVIVEDMKMSRLSFYNNIEGECYGYDIDLIVKL